ncbi:hypothetical protein AB0H43_24000 [Hamadaea sp. NPDC050747]|uniref:hypothetical protein n=1 Tax=Hamadaea sp. NPDC050747 TaxID=3155789 RepID=UPI0033E4BC32
MLRALAGLLALRALTVLWALRALTWLLALRALTGLLAWTGRAVALTGRAELRAVRWLAVRRLRVPRLPVDLAGRPVLLTGLTRALRRLPVRSLRAVRRELPWRELAGRELAGRRTVAGLGVAGAGVLRVTGVLGLAGVVRVTVGPRRQRLAVRPELRLGHAGRPGRERPGRRSLAARRRVGVVVGGLTLSGHLGPGRGRRASPSWDVRPGPVVGALDGHATPREDRVAGAPAKTAVPPFPADDRVTPAG